MILYDKNSNFLGMSQSELSMLGYEDMEEFKSNFNDFADLFVNQPGYISKFKNFSWIDYTLHSGAPNKNILLKHKNGTEIEAKVIISEVSLISQINDGSVIYCVEISTTLPATEYDIKTDIDFSSLEDKINTNKKHDQILADEEDEQSDIIQTFEDILSSEEQSKINNNKPMENLNENLHLKITEDDTKDIQDDFKLQIEDDFDMDQEIDIKNDSKEIFTDEEVDKPLKLKVVFDEDEIPSDIQTTTPPTTQKENNETFIINPEPVLDDISKKKIEFDDIDFMAIAEDTGMDLSDIAEIIEDFIKESEDYIEKTKEESLGFDFVKNEAMKLKGVASNLKITNITNTLDSILENSDDKEEEILLQIFQKQIKNLEEQLS